MLHSSRNPIATFLGYKASRFSKEASSQYIEYHPYSQLPVLPTATLQPLLTLKFFIHPTSPANAEVQSTKILPLLA
jgi:hypothetical protein